MRGAIHPLLQYIFLAGCLVKHRDNFTASRPALGPIQPPIQWVPAVVSPGVKRPWREADHSPPSNVEVKNAWRYTSTPQYSSWLGA
jgi:hypothetical protein